MKIAIIGSRKWENKNKIECLVRNLMSAFEKDDILISGGAKGIDEMAEKNIDRWGLDKKIFKPDMSQGYDVRQYHIRNKKIIAEADIIISFWNKKSKGTLSSLKALIKSIEEKECEE